MTGTNCATYVVGGKYTRDTKLRVLEYYFRNGGDRFGNKQETANKFNIDSKTVFRFLQLPEIVQLARRRARNKKCAAAASGASSEVQSPASTITSSSSCANRPVTQNRPSAKSSTSDSVHRPVTSIGSSADVSELDQLNLSAADAKADQLSQSAVENFSNLAQLVRVFDVATDELRNILLYECQLIYECRVCSALFRNLAQIITHKRRYCLQRHVDTRQMSPTGAAAMRTLASVEPNGPAAKPPSCHTTTRSRDITSSANLQPRVILEPVDGSAAAVFQTRARSSSGDVMVGGSTGVSAADDGDKSDAGETMSARLTALQRWRETITDGSTVCLGADGKIVDAANVPVLGEEEVAASLNPLLVADRHVCQHCNTEFSSRKTLSHHVRSLHAGSRVYFPCGCCSGTFTSMFSLERHLQRVHKKKYAELRRLKDQARSRSFLRNVDEVETSSATGDTANTTTTTTTTITTTTGEAGSVGEESSTAPATDACYPDTDSNNTATATAVSNSARPAATRASGRNTTGSSKKVCAVPSSPSISGDGTAVYCHLCLSGFPSLHLLLCHQLVAHYSGRSHSPPPDSPHHSNIIQRCDYSVARSRNEAATLTQLKNTPTDGDAVDIDADRQSRLPLALLVDFSALQCRVCGRHCSNCDSLMRHASTHLASGAVTVVVCPLCGRDRPRSMTSDRLIAHLVSQHECSRMDAAHIARRVCTVQAVDTLELAETREVTCDRSTTLSPIPVLPAQPQPPQKKHKERVIFSVVKTVGKTSGRQEKCQRLGSIIDRHSRKLASNDKVKSTSSLPELQAADNAINTEIREDSDDLVSPPGPPEVSGQPTLRSLSLLTSEDAEFSSGADPTIASADISDPEDEWEQFMSYDVGAETELFSGDFNNNNDDSSTDHSELSGQRGCLQRCDNNEKPCMGATCSLAAAGLPVEDSSDDVKLTIKISSLLRTVARSGGETETTGMLDCEDDIPLLERSESRNSGDSADSSATISNQQTSLPNESRPITKIASENVLSPAYDMFESQEMLSQDSAVGSFLSKPDGQVDDINQPLCSSQVSVTDSCFSFGCSASNVSPTKRSPPTLASPLKCSHRKLSPGSDVSNSEFRQKQHSDRSRYPVVSLSRLTDEEVIKMSTSPIKIGSSVQTNQTEESFAVDSSGSSSYGLPESTVGEQMDVDDMPENRSCAFSNDANWGKYLNAPTTPDKHTQTDAIQIKCECVNSPVDSRDTTDMTSGSLSEKSSAKHFSNRSSRSSSESIQSRQRPHASSVSPKSTSSLSSEASCSHRRSATRKLVPLSEEPVSRSPQKQFTHR